MLVEVAFDHGDGRRRMTADLCGCELGPGCEAAGVDGIAPSGEGGREHGSVVICDAVGDGGRGREKGVGQVRRAGDKR